MLNMGILDYFMVSEHSLIYKVGAQGPGFLTFDLYILVALSTCLSNPSFEYISWHCRFHEEDACCTQLYSKSS